jgi:thiol-disulfide isomerase/thioredoxin
MRKIVIFFLIAIGFSCSRDGSRTVIKGQLDHANGKYLHFQELTVKNDGVKDSILLDKSGDFKFVRKIQYPSFFLIWIGKEKPITLVALPGEKIKIEGQADSLFFNYKVSGSEDSKRAQIINIMYNRMQFKLDSLNRVFQQFLTNPNIAQIRETLTNNYNRVIEEQHDFTIMFLNQNPTSVANIIALYQQTDPETNSYVLYKEDDFKYFDHIDSLLFRKYPKAPHILSFHTNVNGLRIQRQQLKMQRMLSAMGAKAPEIALPTPKGDTLRLSSLKGKYVLLDFWASWCSPCREENQNLVAIYNKYNSKGFEIFQVSLDKTKDAWVKAIRDDKLTWMHVSDLKYWQSAPAKTYNVESIPTCFLLDKDGVIIARDLRGESLDDRLSAIFDK